MPFDKNINPNLIDSSATAIQYANIQNDSPAFNNELLTISERITQLMKYIFISYLLPNIFIVCALIIFFIFLGYRYNIKKKKDILNKKFNYGNLEHYESNE